MIEIEIPWNPDISKNKKFAFKGKKVLAKGYAEGKNEIIWRMIATGKHRSFKPATKTYVIIYCYRPHFKGDMQNFEEAICDAVKEAIGVGDNYFAVFVDYDPVVDKDNARINIKVKQDYEDKITIKVQRFFQKIFRI